MGNFPNNVENFPLLGNFPKAHFYCKKMENFRAAGKLPDVGKFSKFYKTNFIECRQFIYFHIFCCVGCRDTNYGKKPDFCKFL